MGVGVACQILFLIIARDPVRYRAMMIPAVLEKFTFVAAVVPLFLLSRVNAVVLGLSLVDLVLGILFVVAYVKTPSDDPGGRGAARQ